MKRREASSGGVGAKTPGYQLGALRSMDNQDECGLAMRAQLQPKGLSEDRVSRRTEMAHAAFGEESQKTTYSR